MKFDDVASKCFRVDIHLTKCLTNQIIAFRQA